MLGWISRGSPRQCHADGNLVINETGDNNANNFAQLILAGNNTITAANVVVGGSSAGAGNGATTPNMLKLGSGTKNINTTSSVLLGRARVTVVMCCSIGATGTVKLRNLAGTGRANMTMGPNGSPTLVIQLRIFSIARDIRQIWQLGRLRHCTKRKNSRQHARPQVRFRHAGIS